MSSRKPIGLLAFGHRMDHPDSAVRTGAGPLLQSAELAQAAEDLCVDGAYFRVHHFARQLGTLAPLLTAAAVRTERIAFGTGGVDMRYANPLGFAADIAFADLLSRGRIQLGVSRGSPEQVIDGWLYSGFRPAEGGPAPT